VDLFSGCGGLSLGLQEAGRRNGVPVDVALAVDIEPQALSVLADNLAPSAAIVADLSTLLAPHIDARVSDQEAELVAAVGRVDLLVGGPPCQGNSNLNNRTRRTDPRNLLYGRMARAAAIFGPRTVLIENVPSVRHAAQNVVTATQKQLTGLGYRVAEHVLDSTVAGVPQRRRRHLLLAIDNTVDIDPQRLLHDFAAACPQHTERTVKWAIGDLRNQVVRGLPGGIHRDAPGRLTATNKDRIAFLFREGLYNLPNAQRPKCHQGQHSYVSMYGRLRWDEPAQTVTSGFGSPGQGRYVHPSQRRTLTPHASSDISRLVRFLVSFLTRCLGKDDRQRRATSAQCSPCRPNCPRTVLTNRRCGHGNRKLIPGAPTAMIAGITRTVRREQPRSNQQLATSRARGGDSALPLHTQPW
jgi:DNA (cytosine-5)-methyltransferase 1